MDLAAELDIFEIRHGVRPQAVAGWETQADKAESLEVTNGLDSKVIERRDGNVLVELNDIPPFA